MLNVELIHKLYQDVPRLPFTVGLGLIHRLSVTSGIHCLPLSLAVVNFRGRNEIINLSIFYPSSTIWYFITSRAEGHNHVSVRIISAGTIGRGGWR